LSDFDWFNGEETLCEVFLFQKKPALLKQVEKSHYDIERITTMKKSISIKRRKIKFHDEMKDNFARMNGELQTQKEGRLSRQA